MRIKDILSEAPVTGSHMRARQRVSPDLVNMIANKSQYEKELAAVKAAQPKDQKPSSERDTIHLQGLYLNNKDIQHYADTQDLNFIYEKSAKWYARNMPVELMKLVYQEPDWQKAVKRLWDIAVIYLHAKDKEVDHSGKWYERPEYADSKRAKFVKKSKTTTAQRAALDIPQGVKPGGIVDMQRQIQYTIQKYQQKFGIDKHGLRIPGR